MGWRGQYRSEAGLAVAPLIVVAISVAYLTSEGLTGFIEARVGAAPESGQTARPAADAPSIN